MAARTPDRRRLAAQIAVVERWRTGSDPSLPTLRRDLAVATAAEHLERALAHDPPPTPEQLASLASLLGGGAS